MNGRAQPQSMRRPFAGLLQIARYNWPQYAGGLAVVLAATVWLRRDHGSLGWARLALWMAALPAGWWCLASLAASHWIIGASDKPEAPGRADVDAA
jgi:hypothetical protein